MNITTNELAGLKGIVDSDYYDPDYPLHPVWTWSANPFPAPRTFSGVVASLKKKGLVQLIPHGKGETPDEDCIALTQEGLNVLAQ